MPVNPMTQSKADRKFEKPVSWLLGRQLIASLKSTLLYTAFGNKIDARDWMDAKVFPPAHRPVDEAWRTMYVRDETEPVDFTSPQGEFWFDYISDTGDGMTATYSIAYLCLSDLWTDVTGTELPPGDPEYGNKVLLRMRTKPTDSIAGLKKLPRGEFLMVGGDTSYHMADYASLHMRFQLPFLWAYNDLREDEGMSPIAQMTPEEKDAELKRLRPIFGIPGNHDYYDMLDGFRRQFREPTISRSEATLHPHDYESAQLRIPGFRRYQETSYVALRLPFDWMIWGLDTEVGKIDERQRDFFKGLMLTYKPKKLIVCTSAPTTVFGKYANKDDEKSAKAFLQLELPRPFLRTENELPVDAADEVKRKKDPPERKLGNDEIRLDLAGDVHHYARYWGPPSPNTQPTRTHIPAKVPKTRTNYASVMSGLGGAFHHPSTTTVDEIREQALYPNENDSRRAVAGEIFNPWRVVKGGGVWFVGGLVAIILAFAAIADRSSRPAIHNFILFTQLGITERDRYEPTVRSKEEAKRVQGDFKSSLVPRILGIETQPFEPKPIENGCGDEGPVYLWGKCRTLWPWEYVWGFWMVMFTLPALLIAILLMRRHYKAWKDRVEVDIDARKPGDADAPEAFNNDVHVRKVNWTIWLSTLVIALMAIVSVLLIMPYRNFITPFGNSLLVLLSIIWAGGATYLSLKYSDWLFEQASKRSIRRRDWAITWVLTACAFGGLAIGLWVFGKNNPAAYLVADMVFVLVASAIPVLLIVLGWKMGGEHQKGAGKFGMALIGLWHGLLQIGVAIFLIKKGTWLTVLLSVAFVLIFWWCGRTLMESNMRAWLTLAFFVFGAVMLLLPPLVYDWLITSGPHVLGADVIKAVFWPHTFDPSVPISTKTYPFSTFEWWINFGGWWQLIPILLAGVFGAFLSCVWLGWYFGVSLAFHGHNNESGGAARIERFKQLVRFRLTPDSLTGYVIAVDDPKRDGKLLDPHLIDVFHLTRIP